jgi:septal ring factor EnvC (AmiA/AmiB activator)
MASSDEVMKKLAKLEKQVDALSQDGRDLKAAAWRTTEILTDHSEQLSSLDRRLTSMDGRLTSMDDKLTAVVDRLDRLIAVTMLERTAGVERLGDIERRLTRLEERVGS